MVVIRLARMQQIGAKKADVINWKANRLVHRTFTVTNSGLRCIEELTITQLILTIV